MQIVTSDPFGGRNVVFDNIIAEIPGGAGLNVTRLDYLQSGKEYIEAGVPVYYDPATRIAEVCKSAKAIDGGGSTTPRIQKKNHFKVGDILNDGTTGATITAIDKDTSEDYDIFTVNTALVYAAGTEYVQGAATGSSTTILYTPNGVIKSPTFIKEGNADVPVVTIADMREDALVYPIPALYAKPLRGGTTATGSTLITLR